MTQRLLMLWAVSATAVAIASVGYIAGKRAGSAQVPAPRLATETPAMTTPGARQEPRPAYAVPSRFDGAANEWRTDAGNTIDGYAALFDPASRRIIVEKCRHPGYQVDESGVAVEPSGNYCVGVLNAGLNQLADTKAHVTGHDGRDVVVKIDTAFDREPPILQLQFEDHDITLMPGSKNDLIQQMERNPIIAPQKKRYLMAVAQRRMASDESIPRFRLPDDTNTE